MTKLTVFFAILRTRLKPKTVGALGRKTGRVGTTRNTESPDGVQRSHQSRLLTYPTFTVTESRLMDDKIIFIYLVCRFSEAARVDAVG